MARGFFFLPIFTPLVGVTLNITFNWTILDFEFPYFKKLPTFSFHILVFFFHAKYILHNYELIIILNKHVT